LQVKVLRIKKFASKIFCLEPTFVYAAPQGDFTGLCGVSWSKRRGIKPFPVVRTIANRNSGCDGALPAPDREQ